MVRRTSLVALALLLVAFAAPPLLATSLVVVPDPALADQAELVVRAEVTGLRAEKRGGRIVTEATVRVVETVTGYELGEVTVRALGGELTTGEVTKIFGGPRFVEGDRLLLFLRPNADGTFHVLHLAQGLFHERGAGEDLYFERHLDDVHIVTLPGLEKAQTGVARHGESFVSWLRDRASGREREADYFVELPPTERAELAPKFTLLGDDDVFRWTEFGTGGTVEWRRHSEGHDALADGGRGAFDVARGVWNDEPNTALRLVDAGTTDATGGFDFDGDDLDSNVNAIYFRDIADDIEEDFSCSTGGTLAIGGVTAAFVAPHTWRGADARRIAGGDIVINDGTTCFFRNNPTRAAEVYAHELGHSLGLGHSCGDESSPPCGSSPRLDAALMRAQVHGGGFGAQLGADDVEGLRYLYDASFSGAVPCEVPVGHGNYCRDCGTCGQGEGDCDRDSDCANGLVCADDIGAQFGFGPGIDVCVAPGGGGGGGGDCPWPLGHGHYCRDCGPCGVGDGDCDRDTDCTGNLVCAQDVGAQFGFNPGIDVCVEPGGGGGGGDCPWPLGHGHYCRDCGPCVEGEGDCDRDSDCGGNLTCGNNIGAQFGFNPGIDVCVDAGGQSCPVPEGHGDYCTLCGPCGFGQGDCDRDSHCQTGLACVDNIGAEFGFGPGIDVCI